MSKRLCARRSTSRRSAAQCGTPSALSTTKYTLLRRNRNGNVACETRETTCTSNRPKTGACSYRATVPTHPMLHHMLRAGAGRSIASSLFVSGTVGRHPVMCPFDVHLFRGPCHMTNTGLFHRARTRRQLQQGGRRKKASSWKQQWSSIPSSSKRRGGFGSDLCSQHSM